MILVNGAGLVLIGFIIWWFWLYRPRPGVAAAPGQVVEIRVRDGVYDPAVVEATAGKGISLKFFREDETACSALVMFPELGIQKELPLGRAVVLRIVPEKAGAYVFQCQMGMYRGVLKVN